MAARRTIAAQRGLVERLLRHAEHLPPADRALVHGVYDRGLSAGALARAAGCPPRRRRSRLRRILGRVSSPAFCFVLRHQHDWPPQRRQIAHAVICAGQTQRAAAAALGLSLHRVRRELDHIAALCESQQQRDQSPDDQLPNRNTDRPRQAPRAAAAPVA